MYYKNELAKSLSQDDLVQTLLASGLPEKEEYTEDEADRFRECRQLVEQQGKTYYEVAQIFQQHGVIPIAQPQPTTELQPTEPDTQAKAKKSKNGKKPSESMDFDSMQTMDFDSMQSWISKEIGTRISPIELGNIIQACGLPDQEEYTKSECERVRDGASMFKNQGKSLATVADCFGKTNSDLDMEADEQEILGMVGSAALAIEEDLIQVLNQVSAKQGKAISAMYERLLLSHTAHQLKERQSAREKMAQFSEQLEAFIQGKSSIPRIRMVNPPALDQTNLKSLPESSDKL